jgi:hypothetical protein
VLGLVSMVAGVRDVLLLDCVVLEDLDLRNLEMPIWAMRLGDNYQVRPENFG